MVSRIWLVVFVIVGSLAGCGEETKSRAPAPQEISDNSIGHYCGMSLPEHAGPKGQVFVADRKSPYWFSSVREVFAFVALPEEPKNVLAIYVNDMGKAKDWNQPERGTWIDARRAWYVIGSDWHGGMDVDEAIPFGDQGKARQFAASRGGRLVRFDDMPQSYIFPGGDDDIAAAASEEGRK